MENISFDSIDEVDDISTLDGYKVARAAGLSEKEALRAVEKSSRDNARTPFQWDGSENAGFTTGKPWLRVNPNYTEINLADQRNLTRLRKNPDYQETFTYGELVPYLEDRHNVMAYLRKSGSQCILVMGNYQKEPQTLPLPSAPKKILLNNLHDLKTDGERVTLDGYQVIVAEL